MRHAFEPIPLLVAAGIGAALAYLIMTTVTDTSQDPNTGTVCKSVYVPTMVALQGAAIGAGVQIGVRLFGVS